MQLLYTTGPAGDDQLAAVVAFLLVGLLHRSVPCPCLNVSLNFPLCVTVLAACSVFPVQLDKTNSELI